MVISGQFFYSNTQDDYNNIMYTVACEYYIHACSNYVELFVLSVHGSSLDDFQQALTAPAAQLERVEII